MAPEETLHTNAEVLLELLLPSETFDRKPIRGVATEITLLGFRMKSFQMDEVQSDILEEGGFDAKASLFLPYLEDPFTARVRVNYCEFRLGLKGNPDYTILSLSFAELDKDQRDQLRSVMRRVTSDSIETVNIRPFRLHPPGA